MKASTVAVAVAVAVVVVGAGLFAIQQGSTTSGSHASSSTSYTTSLSTTSSTGSSGGITTGVANSTDGLQLQLKLDFYHGADAGVNGSSMVTMTVDEYNLRVSSSNVSASSSWAVNGLSDGPCGSFDLPYGVAIYQGFLTEANLTGGQLQPLQIYPPVACPMFVRYVTGYLFQPSSDMALILPGTGNATQMLSTVNATGIYSPNSAVSSGMGGLTSVETPFPAGTYTAVAGDEWGALVVLHFTIAPDSGVAGPTAE
jgi:hypothetical protein